jgi:hypothetical protein
MELEEINYLYFVFVFVYILNSVSSRDLVPDSVALTDVLAPPDFILNSALGHSRHKIITVFLWRKVV